ncbi:sensor histidine kinase [Agrobacterium larrymoorei]|uniref:histidine kinase n=2 Tax=Agrobacterium larrymoorei TaxID=160699 RepID=A0A4D7DXT0_9HYPH|nr:sensor histidine kinase [Agrobacterium larrymoorei]QCJ00288.1 hypothetical protein CFBP5473_20405 [Agrobacterium larrymoorei]QYA09268.1 sensor histidine kinase [Agrobacterium larrymoorei]
MSIFRFVLSTCLALFAGVTMVMANDDDQSSPVLQLHLPLEKTISLDGFIDVAFVDEPSENLLLDSATRFRHLSGHDVNLGFVRTSVWMRFRIALPPEAVEAADLLLSIKPNFTDELNAYVGKQKAHMTKQDFERFELGDHAPREETISNTLANILPLKLYPGETTVVYLRARNHDASLNVSAELISPQHYLYWTLIQNTVQGAWFGGMTILLAIQFFFYYFDRKKFYILLAADILAVSCTYFGSLGFARFLLFNQGGLGNDFFTSASSWFGLTAGSLSFSAILELRKRYPRLHYFFCFAALAGIVGVFCVFAGVNRYFILLAGPLILLLTTFAMSVALLDLIRTPGAQQGLNFSAFVLLWAGLIATNGQRYGVLSLPSWVASFYAITSIIHFTLLTGSLAVRLRNAETSARDADRRALLAAGAAEQHAIDLVTERTKELRAATLVAETALRAELEAQEQQVRFMEVISHQYRTPLGIIRTNLESVRLTLSKKDAANRQRLDRANIGITRLVEVLEVNLTRSRVQGLAYKPSFKETSVSDVINSAVSSATDLFQGAELTVTSEPGSERAKIYADAEMLRLAILNLLENAFKFSAPVGSTSIWLEVRVIDDQLQVQVRDRGIGIEHEDVEKLILERTRGKNASHIQGSGVGLALVKRTVDVHRGKVAFASLPGGGTSATISLPLTAAHRPPF